MTEFYDKCDWCKRYYDSWGKPSIWLPTRLLRKSNFHFCSMQCRDAWVAKKQPREIVQARG